MASLIDKESTDMQGSISDTQLNAAVSVDGYVLLEWGKTKNNKKRK
jgi:hypothetical protein